MKKILTLLTVFLALISCKPQKKNAMNPVTETQKYLVIYYSQTGATQRVAQEIAGKLNADTLRIDVEQPYNGTYEETIERCQKEMASGELPKLKKWDTDLNDYDIIFLGYPIWFGTYAPPIASLIKDIDLTGKKIVPFCTFGSGGLESSMADLSEALPQTEILPGYGVRNARLGKAPEEIDRFLKESGYLEGEVEKLPDYSAQQPVTAADSELFNTACSDYKYPLGKPVTVGKRTTSQGTDYRFTVKSKNGEGKDVEATIFITIGNEQDAQPEFTKVVR